MDTATSTPARDALLAWLGVQAPGHSQAALAQVLGLNQSSVSLWVSGRSRPEPPMRKALELVTGIPEDDWLTLEERALVERVRGKIKPARKPSKRRRSGVTRAVGAATGTEG